MEFIKNFKSVPYSELIKEMTDKYTQSGKTYPELAVSTDLKSTNGVRNAFINDEQTVSDKVLTSIFKEVGLNGFVIWLEGERKYFISTKN